VHKLLLFCLIIISGSTGSFAQNADPVDPWDYWFIMGNKVVFGGVNHWKNSHEIQWRADNNLQQLNTLMYETVLTYSPNSHWEIVPDLRYSVRSNQIQFRPGFGIVRKDYFGENIHQLVQQVKWQIDIGTLNTSQAVRYAPAYNVVIQDKHVVGVITAFLYQWGKDYDNRLTFIRFGPTYALIFDKVHTLSIVPAFGVENLGAGQWVGSFTPIVQLIIRVNKNYKYKPARYINF
jgi:hypothetical protein